MFYLTGIGSIVVGLFCATLLYVLFSIFRAYVCRLLFRRWSWFRSWVCRRWLLRVRSHFSRTATKDSLLWYSFSETAPRCLCWLGAFDLVDVTRAEDGTHTYWSLLVSYYIGLDREVLRSAPIGIKPLLRSDSFCFWGLDARGLVSRRRCIDYLLSLCLWDF